MPGAGRPLLTPREGPVLTKRNGSQWVLGLACKVPVPLLTDGFFLGFFAPGAVAAGAAPGATSAGGGVAGGLEPLLPLALGSLGSLIDSTWDEAAAARGMRQVAADSQGERRWIIRQGPVESQSPQHAT